MIIGFRQNGEASDYVGWTNGVVRVDVGNGVTRRS